MEKYIYEVRNEGLQKYTIIYQNKTFWFCKVNGTDHIRAFPKQGAVECVDKLSGTGRPRIVPSKITQAGQGFYSTDRAMLSDYWDMSRLAAKQENLDRALSAHSFAERNLYESAAFLKCARADLEAAEAEHIRSLSEVKTNG